jgi:hypothetical protein
MDAVAGFRHHDLRFTIEAAFEFGRDQEKHCGASLSSDQEYRTLQFPERVTTERRQARGGVGQEIRSQFRPLFLHQLGSSRLWHFVETGTPTDGILECSVTVL